MPKTDNIKICTCRIEDPHPTPHYLGMLVGNQGTRVYTTRPRRSRSSARRDAHRQLISLADDPNFPLDLL